jgi:hypothetical protein
MTLYELIFILLFLGSVISLLLSAFLRRRGASRKILVALSSVWGLYLAILAVTDVLSSQKVFKVGVLELLSVSRSSEHIKLAPPVGADLYTRDNLGRNARHRRPEF